MFLSGCYRAKRRPGAAGHMALLGPIMAAGLLLMAALCPAQDRKSDPPRVEIAFPVEFDFDFGAANGNAIINRYLPLIGFPIGEEWKLINLTLAVLADAPGGVPGRPGNPDPVPGERVFGLGDLTDAVFLTPPTKSENLVWGFGPVVAIPLATDDRLGSGKWSLGPAFRIAYRPGPWNLGAIAVNLWSFAGDSDRAEVSQLMVRGLVRRRLGKGWYFVYAPIITANWNALSGQKWLVPVGGGIGRRFNLDSAAGAVSVQAYVNVIRPEGAPEWMLRVNFVLPIPGGLR